MLLSPAETENLLFRRKICCRKIKEWKEQQIITEDTEMKIDMYSSLVHEYDEVLHRNATFMDSQFNHIILNQRMQKINVFEDMVIRATAPRPPPSPPVPVVKKIWRTVSGRIRRCFAKRRRVLAERV